jgi:hypothetical protein
MTMTTMGTEDHVTFCQVRANTNGYRLFTDVSVASSMHQSSLMRTRQLLFALADQHHLAVQ